MADVSALQNVSPAAPAAVTPAPMPALRAGQVISAQVLSQLRDGQVRLALPQGTVDVAPPVPLATGATVSLEVLRAGQELTLRLIDTLSQPAASGAPAATVPAATAQPNALPAPAAVSFPAPGAPPPALAAGQPIEGRVVALGADGAVRIATAQGEVTVVSRTPVPLGSPVRLDPPSATGTATLSVLPAPSGAGPVAERLIPVSTGMPTTAATVTAAATSTAGATPSSTAPVNPPAAPATAPGIPSASTAPNQPAPIPLPQPVSAAPTLPLAAAPVPTAAVPGAGTIPLANVVPTMAPHVPPAPPASTALAPVAAAAAIAATTLDGEPGIGTEASLARQAHLSVPSAPAEAPLSAAQRLSLAPSLHTAVGRQQGLAPLMANLQAAVASPDVDLPADVAMAATRVLAARLPLGQSIEADDIAQAVARSGVLFEAALARNTPASQLAGDLKGALLLLRNALRSWLGDQPPAPPTGEAPAPPMRGDPPSAQRPASATISTQASPEDIGRTLLGQTEGALSRTRLLQIASLPDDPLPGRLAAPAPLHVEIPIVFGQQTAVAQFTVERDGHGEGAEAEGSAWRLRFAIDVEPIGPVHALLTLRGGEAAVTIWAERPETASELTARSEELRVALGDAEFEVDDIQVRRGAPTRPVHEPGVVMDRRT